MQKTNTASNVTLNIAWCSGNIYVLCQLLCHQYQNTSTKLVGVVSKINCFL